MLMDMLPDIAAKDKRFKKFVRKSFDIKYKVHKALHDAVRNRIEELQIEADKLRKKEEKAAAVAKAKQERAEQKVTK